MQEKDQEFSKFVEFKALVKKATGKKVKDLGSNNKCECVSNAFIYLFIKEGIQLELIEPHKP